MPYSNLCSVFPLLRHQHHEYFNPQAQTTAAENSPLMQRAGAGEVLPTRYAEEWKYLKKGMWSLEEDITLLMFVRRHGGGHWDSVRKYYGIPRSGKSCRLRWLNQLRLQFMLPGPTDIEMHNFWRRLSRAGYFEETGSLENVGEDICATVDPSSYNMASSTAGNSPSNGVFITCNWSHSAVNVAELIADNAHGSPSATCGDCSGLEEAVGPKVNGEEACKSDSFDVATVEPLSKRRCIDTSNPINFTCPVGSNAILSKVNVSCGTNGGCKDINMTTNNLLATIRHDNGLPCLKLELPSVQRDESADSSSSRSSPCAASQQRSPVDVLECAAISIVGAPLVAIAPSAKVLLQATNDNPLFWVPKDMFSFGELQSDPSSVELPAGLQEDSPWIVPQLEEEESSASAIAPNVAYVGPDDDEDDDGTSIWGLEPGVESNMPCK